MNIEKFDYTLPEGLIAQYPAEPRDAARLMVVHRSSGKIEHRKFRDIVQYLAPTDTLVLNSTRVMSARFKGVRAETGGRVEVFLIRKVAPLLWEAMLKPGGRLTKGTIVDLKTNLLTATVEDEPGSGIRLVCLNKKLDVDWIEDSGDVPLPPYIRRDTIPADSQRYQTVYAEEYGAVAAPTAGLHFTIPLLNSIRQKGTSVVPILLHVGPGTFQSIKSVTVEQHVMDKEYYRVNRKEAELIKKGITRGRIIAVGTTTVRVLETLAQDGFEMEKTLDSYEGHTGCFIYPPYNFRLVDTMLTNFHLPKSTLLLLVSAFAGRELILSAYSEAIKEGYRFYSYGDAMLIV